MITSHVLYYENYTRTGVDIERADDTITPLDKKPTDSRREAFNNQTYIVTKPKVLINNPCCQQTGATS